MYLEFVGFSFCFSIVTSAINLLTLNFVHLQYLYLENVMCGFCFLILR